MIPQTMMLACMRGMTGHIEQLEREYQLNEQDVFLSFLPLAHIFGALPSHAIELFALLTESYSAWHWLQEDERDLPLQQKIQLQDIFLIGVALCGKQRECPTNLEHNCWRY